MGNSRRIGLVAGLAILGCQASADAQTRPGGGAAGRPTGAVAPALNRTAIARPSASATVASPRRADPSFHRLATTRQVAASGSTRAMAAGGGYTARGMTGQDDPLRPYSARIREADLQAAASTTRPQMRTVMPRTVQSSHNYYPGMRIARHCTPSRGAVMAGSLGRGR